ncbi:hypothetical protein GCM10017674_71820 [Streptomyces gardneri]|uniref:Uncharacterized protein n=2 Tax=Streptomyces gardneri TaxID=66892 RepID=A0A4Y3RXJ7_9ACTN|nr:hypothetical protein SGA01_76690 [Streptomyces gardneri]GHH19178.1 hypothetical protein GCM10017674_71820 [Streptomyces gardneri]
MITVSVIADMVPGMGFSGSFIVARAVRPLTKLAAMRASDCVPLWWARDGAWQILQACPIADPDPSIISETSGSVLVCHVVDSDFVTVQAASPDGLSWQCALSPEMARECGLPGEWIGDPAGVGERAAAWARGAGLRPDPVALRAALVAECDPLAEDLVFALVHALGFRFRDGVALETSAV